MPKFVIERQYLVPMYQHIVVEAENLEEACKKAISSEDIGWDSQELDCDSAGATTITNAKMIPEGYEVDAVHSLIIANGDPRGLPLHMRSLATFLSRMRPKQARAARSLPDSRKTTDRGRPFNSR